MFGVKRKKRKKRRPFTEPIPLDKLIEISSDEGEHTVRTKDLTREQNIRYYEVSASSDEEVEIIKLKRTGKKRKRTNSDDEDLNESAEKKRKVDDEVIIVKTVEKPPTNDKRVTFECQICFEDQKIDFIQALTRCKHEFCRGCLKSYYELKINSKHFPIQCPSAACDCIVVPADLELILDRSILEKFEKFSLHHHFEKNPDHYSCCMTPGCEYYFFYETGENHFRCLICEKQYCLKCKVKWHENSTCDQYQKWKIENGEGDVRFDKFVRGQKFKQCPKCTSWVEKSAGCDHMTCRCKSEFCYKCGSEDWRKCPCRLT